MRLADRRPLLNRRAVSAHPAETDPIAQAQKVLRAQSRGRSRASAFLVMSTSPTGTATMTSASHSSLGRSSAESLASAQVRPHFTPLSRGPAEGLSTQEAVRRFRKRISGFERKEMLEYDNAIYTVGRCAQSNKLGHDSAAPNNGFDNARGEYKVRIHDHLAYRYEIVGVLGGGSFGMVMRCLDHRTGRNVAVKVIRNKKRFRSQGGVEISLLNHVRGYDRARTGVSAGAGEGPSHLSCCVHLQNHFEFRNHLCLVFPMLHCNLYEFIKRNRHQGFSPDIIRRFAVQLLEGLRALRECNIVHADLKPENIMLKNEHSTTLRIIDFGSSCYEGETVYTYIQSRFYRAPEVMLGNPYGCPIDVWSLGCILAELHTGWPIFPGEDEEQQMLRVQEVLGMAPPHMIVNSPKAAQFYNQTRTAPRSVLSRNGRRRMPGTKDLHCDCLRRRCDVGLADLIAACLRVDPTTRATPYQLLAHPWVRKGNSQRRARRQGNLEQTRDPSRASASRLGGAPTPSSLGPAPSAMARSARRLSKNIARAFKLPRLSIRRNPSRKDMDLRHPVSPIH